MFKLAIVVLAIVASACAKPGIVAPLAYSAPVVTAPGVVTATSSQVVARNYNGLAAAPIVAAAPVAYAAPAIAAPLAYSAYTASVAAPVAAVASPLKYTAAPILL